MRSSKRIFWKVFRGSCGLPTRSAGLPVGRTHLSGTVVSLVGGDPRVPMSHKHPERGVCAATRKVMTKS
jgi:hypothetical protein